MENQLLTILMCAPFGLYAADAHKMNVIIT